MSVERKSTVTFLLMNVAYGLFFFFPRPCLFAQFEANKYIVYNAFTKLEDGEEFFVKEEDITQSDEDILFAVYKAYSGLKEKVLELKRIKNLILFNDRKHILLYVNHTIDWDDNAGEDAKEYRGEPLFYINGVKGTIDFLGTFLPGFFVLDEQKIIINRIDPGVINSYTENLSVFSINERRIIGVCDANTFLAGKVGPGNKDFYHLSFPDYKNGQVKVQNGCIKVYFDQWGEDGPRSFFAYLNIANVCNFSFAEDMNTKN